MNRMHYMPQYFLVFILLLLVSSCVRNRQGIEGEKPNIILIISDDQSWTDYGFLGHEHINTPHIDQLAAEGLTFTRGYSTAPLCRPALASLVTGLYPHQHRIVGNDPIFASMEENRYGTEWLKAREELNEPIVSRFSAYKSLPRLLGESGYVSLQTGKWW